MLSFLLETVRKKTFFKFICNRMANSPALSLWNSGSLVVNYPFDDDIHGNSYYSKSPDDEVFQHVSRAYSEVTGYRCCGFSFTLI